MSARPNEHVRAWLGARSEALMHVSVLTLGELHNGVERKRHDRSQWTRLHEAVTRLQARFAGRILPVDESTALRWGELRAQARASGRGPLPAIDALIAATAVVHDLVVVTRNERYFERAGIAVVNPFEGTGASEPDFR